MSGTQSFETMLAVFFTLTATAPWVAMPIELGLTAGMLVKTAVRRRLRF